jgi:hypothetical protein
VGRLAGLTHLTPHLTPHLTRPKNKNKKSVRGPGIEPGSTAWKATMLTITPATLSILFLVASVCILGSWWRWRGRKELLSIDLPLSNCNCNCLFSLGVEHSLSKRKVGGSNPPVGCSFFSFFFLYRWTKFRRSITVNMSSPYGPMDKAPAYGAGDSGFESQYGLIFFSPVSRVRGWCNFPPIKKSTQGED